MRAKREAIELWLSKAESDIKAAEILIKEKDAPTDVICFHAQQAVEKLLKAYLTHTGVKSPKTHDIATLLELCIKADKDFGNLETEGLEKLTFYAVEVRYPDDFYQPTLKEAEEALAQALKLREFILTKLKLQEEA